MRSAIISTNVYLLADASGITFKRSFGFRRPYRAQKPVSRAGAFAGRSGELNGRGAGDQFHPGHHGRKNVSCSVLIAGLDEDGFRLGAVADGVLDLEEFRGHTSTFREFSRLFMRIWTHGARHGPEMARAFPVDHHGSLRKRGRRGGAEHCLQDVDLKCPMFFAHASCRFSQRAVVSTGSRRSRCLYQGR